MGAILHRVACIYNPSSAGAHDLRQQLFQRLIPSIPIGGYNRLIGGLLEGCDVELNTDFFHDRNRWMTMADKVVFTGRIDEFYGYRFGKLEYRTMRFETELLDEPNHQAMPWSTTLHPTYPTPALSSTSTSRPLAMQSTIIPTPSSLANTQLSGSTAWNPFIPSTILATRQSMSNIVLSLSKNRT